MYEEVKPKEIPLDNEAMSVIIPICCREGHEDCPHVPKKQKRIKTNIGL